MSERENIYEYEQDMEERAFLNEVSSDLLSDTPNPAAIMNPSGYQNNIDKEELEAALIMVEESGYEIPVPRRQTVTEAVSIRSVLQVIDVTVAHALQKYPNLFTVDDDVTDVFITPIELKAYYALLFLNRMRSVNQISGAAVGTIPYLSDDAPMPRCLFELFSVMAPYKEGDERGVLTMDYDTEFSISNECIFGPDYNQDDLSTPACPTFHSPVGILKGIHCLQKDLVYGESIVVESSVLIRSLSDFWTNDVDQDRLYFAINQIYETTHQFSNLPLAAVSADFFACSRNDGNSPPANQMMCPFSNYDADHATVFSFYKGCEIRATMNQKVSMQAPTRPNDNTPAAQYSKEYVVGVFVQAGDRIRHNETEYLGSRKYYTYDDKSHRPAPQFKKIDPEMVKTQIVDVLRSQMAALATAIRAQTEVLPTPALAAIIVNAVRFYKEASIAMTSKIFKTVQLQCLSFMTNPSHTAMSNQCNEVQLIGSVALLYRGLAPIVDNGNIVLPFFEFGKDSLTSPWYEMDHAWDALAGDHSNLFGSTLEWSDNSAEVLDEFAVHFQDQVVNQLWIDGYSALPGARKVPFYAVLCSKNYERMIESFSVAQGMWLNMDERVLGGSTMLTFTKFVRNLDEKTPLPTFDTSQNPSITPYPIKYLLNIERLLFMNFVFGLPLSEATIGVHSLDIELDDADDLNEFPYASPLSLIPGAQNPWSLLNSDVSNSNGIVQKAYAANVAKTHSEPKFILGVPVIPKNDDNMCFWEGLASSIGAIGDAVLTGVNTFTATGSVALAATASVATLATDIFTADTNLYYAGSPSLKAPDVVRQRRENDLYARSIDPHKKNNTKRQPPKKKVDKKAKKGGSRNQPSSVKGKKPSPKRKPVDKKVSKPKNSTKPARAANAKTSNLTSSVRNSTKKKRNNVIKQPVALPKHLKPSRVVPAPVKTVGRITKQSTPQEYVKLKKQVDFGMDDLMN